jgi:membrane protein DedA with SNARE-associated domain
MMQSERSEKGRTLKTRIAAGVSLLLLGGISYGLYYYGSNPEHVATLSQYKYLGAFLVSLIGNATIFLPSAVLPVLSGLGVIFYPVTGLIGPIVVGLVGGLGAGIGEMVSYGLGYTGRGVIQNQKHYRKVEGWLKKWGTISIFVLAMVPIFFDVVGLVLGALRFPAWKYFLLTWAGRTITYVVVVTLVSLGFKDILLPIFSGFF